MPGPPLGVRFGEALNFAFSLHQNQTRKGSDVPYFAHLMSVSALVLEHGGDETAAIAALLHDATEDQGGRQTGENIERVFGKEVCHLVRECSEVKTRAGKDIPWAARKLQYINSIPTKTMGARLVSTADKVHNARAVLADYRIQGEDLWKRFNGGRKTVWYYQALVKAFRAAQTAQDPPELLALTDELDRIVTELVALAGPELEPNATQNSPKDKTKTLSSRTINGIVVTNTTGQGSTSSVQPWRGPIPSTAKKPEKTEK